MKISDPRVQEIARGILLVLSGLLLGVGILVISLMAAVAADAIGFPMPVGVCIAMACVFAICLGLDLWRGLRNEKSEATSNE